jgi:hypothetical protein
MGGNCHAPRRTSTRLAKPPRRLQVQRTAAHDFVAVLYAAVQLAAAGYGFKRSGGRRERWKRLLVRQLHGNTVSAGVLSSSTALFRRDLTFPSLSPLALGANAPCTPLVTARQRRAYERWECAQRVLSAGTRAASSRLERRNAESREANRSLQRQGVSLAPGSPPLRRVCSLRKALRLSETLRAIGAVRTACPIYNEQTRRRGGEPGAKLTPCRWSERFASRLSAFRLSRRLLAARSRRSHCKAAQAAGVGAQRLRGARAHALQPGAALFALRTTWRRRWTRAYDAVGGGACEAASSRSLRGRFTRGISSMASASASPMGSPLASKCTG